MKFILQKVSEGFVRVLGRLIVWSGILFLPVQTAYADIDPAEFEIPVTRVVRLSDLPASAKTAPDAELSAAANFVLADINAKRKKLADDWKMEGYSAEIVNATPGYFIVKYSYRLINLPSHMSSVVRQYCALLFERKGQEWQAGACVKQPMDKNSLVMDINRDGRLEIVADKTMMPGGPGKGDVPGSIPEGFTNIGDLNGDNSPELMKTDNESFRDSASIKRTIFVWSPSDKKYKPTQLVTVTKSSGSCNSDNLVENITFDMAAKPFPAVLIQRKHWKSDEKCGERVVMERTDNYQWNAVFKDYVTLLSNVGGGELAASRRSSAPSEELPVQKIIFAQGGAVKELNKSFDLKTVLSGFEKKGEFVYFKAEDDEWKSDYAWRPKDETLHFMAQSKKTGKAAYSRPWGTNVFKKKDGQ